MSDLKNFIPESKDDGPTIAMSTLVNKTLFREVKKIKKKRKVTWTQLVNGLFRALIAEEKKEKPDGSN